MAFKRSAVRSRLSPPRDLEREFRVFFFFAARPRFQRFHDSTVGNGLHENAFRAFRGNRWERGNRAIVAFVEIVGIVATVGFVGMRGTVISLVSLETWGSLYVVCAKIVISLLSWEWPVPAPLSASPFWLAPSVSFAGASHACADRPAFPGQLRCAPHARGL